MAYMLNLTRYSDVSGLNKEKYAQRVKHPQTDKVGVFIPQPISTSSHNLNLPIDVVSYNTGKYLNEAAYGNFYYRLISNKNLFTLGAITGDKTEDFYVFNGYAEPVSITEISMSNLDGVEILSQNGNDVVLPLTLVPYRSAYLKLHVSASGSSSLNGSFEVVLSNGERVEVYVTGTRVILLNVMPNWAEGLSEVFEYRTDILTSFNKKEQRRSLMSQPRRKISYTGLVQGELHNQLKNKLFSWQDKALSVPLWYQQTTLLGPAKIGSYSLVVDVKKYDFQVGANLCIWVDFNNVEVLEITAIDGNNLTLKAPLSNNYDAGVWVYPTLEVHLEDSVSLRHHTSTVGEIDFELTADIHRTKMKMPTLYQADMTYDGLEVLLRKPNWAENIEDEYEAAVDIVDYGYGVQRWFNRNTPSLATRSMTFVAKTYDEILWFKSFIHRNKGAFKSFIVPSWTDDVRLNEPYGEGSLTLRVRGDNLPLTADDFRDKKYLRVNTAKGVYYLTISGISIDDKGVVITTTSSMNVNLEVNEVINISFMAKYRFASDEIGCSLLTRDTAEFNFKLKQLREV